jgi:hypothetical protein
MCPQGTFAFPGAVIHCSGDLKARARFPHCDPNFTEQANFSSVCSPGEVLAPYFSAANPSYPRTPPNKKRGRYRQGTALFGVI